MSDIDLSSNKSNSNLNLANITTYQSGVAQASAFRTIKRYTALALREYHLSCMQWFTIGTILDAGSKGIRISDLAQKLDTTLAYMTTTVNLLESRKIICKKTHRYDARTKLVSVHPSYKKKCRVIEHTLRKKLRELLYANIEREELATYIRVLYKINQL